MISGSLTVSPEGGFLNLRLPMVLLSVLTWQLKIRRLSRRHVTLTLAQCPVASLSFQVVSIRIILGSTRSNVYDLKNRVWISKTEQPQADGMYSKGAYRSVAASSKKRVQTPRQGGDLKSATTHAYSVDEEGEGGGKYIPLYWNSFDMLIIHQTSGATPTMTLPKFDVNSISSLPTVLNTSLPISTRLRPNLSSATNPAVCADHPNPQVFVSPPEVSLAIH